MRAPLPTVSRSISARCARTSFAPVSSAWKGATRGALLLFGLAHLASAQVNPSRPWRTIRTEHFYVHFTPELVQVAQRAAATAESAYVRLRTHLAPPRGKIDLVIADNVDFANGYATPYPTNRIVIFANPPMGDETLRFVDDPNELVITHELVHIFHLDRALGVWRIFRMIFGRDPSYFPNGFQPSWLVEGLAVYYESLITGSGRLKGSNHAMIARTAAGARDFPRIDQLSLASPHFPYGYRAYAFGSLFVDYLGRTYGDSSVRAMVEASSAGWIPLWLDWSSRRAYRRSFTSAYTTWTRSQVAAEPVTASSGIAGWADLTDHGGYANVPRWMDDSTLTYDGTSGRTSYGAYRLRLRSDSGLGSSVLGLGSGGSVVRSRLARRTTRSANVLLANGDLLYSQLEYRNPYDLRSDLYVDKESGGARRLTHGARLSHPDARRDGMIVAVQTTPAATRLALVSPNGKVVTPITTGTLDEMWAEPRWSPDGRHIAAVRWARGGTFDVVIVDTVGRIVQSVARERAVVADPSWSADGRHVYFSSDRTGITNLYRVEFREGGEAAFERLTDTRTGLFEPQLSPDGRALVAVAYRNDGYHIGITSTDSLRPQPAERIDSIAAREPQLITKHDAPSTKYSPWRSLVPRYWLPFAETALDSNAVRLGAYTSSRDLVDRHSYEALVYIPTDMTGLTGSLGYSYAGLGNPVLSASGSLDRSTLGCVLDASQQKQCIGFLRRRVRSASFDATFNRLRERAASYISVGGGIEARDYNTAPADLIDRVDSWYRHTLYWPRVTMALGWSNIQYPKLAVSPEDGVSFAFSSRFRWRHDRPVLPVPTGPDTADRRGDAATFISAFSAYKSLRFLGFGRHVFAARVAGGWTDSRAPGYLEVGGVSGGTVEIFPGYTLGEGRRSFPVRGFPAAAMIGMRAYSLSAEYRAPLLLPGRGLGLLPAFVDRSSLTIFGDLGSAWCPALYQTRLAPAYSLCSQGDYDIGRTTFLSYHPIIYQAANTVGSVGAELNVVAATLDWDRPIRYRVGVAHPVVGLNLLSGIRPWSAYVAVAASF